MLFLFLFLEKCKLNIQEYSVEPALLNLYKGQLFFYITWPVPLMIILAVFDKYKIVNINQLINLLEKLAELSLKRAIALAQKILKTDLLEENRKERLKKSIQRLENDLVGV